jgi:hypothetical protein
MGRGMAGTLGRLTRCAVAALVCALLGAAAQADEIHLKDGSKIDGTIVGYEGNSFRVQTSYGFALVRKDSIAEIIPGDKPASGKTAAVKPGDADAGAPKGSPAATPSPSSEKAPQDSAEAQPASNSLVIAAAAPVAPRAPASSTSAKPALPPALKAAALPGLPTPMVAPGPEAPTIKEALHENLYVNQTFGFQMYTPPGWQIIKDATSALPNTITAVGPSDETALLVIGRDIGKESLDAHAFATDHTLRGIYDNYRLDSTKQILVGGLPAIEQHSRGVADGRDWSVTLVTFGRGGDIFTILAMTHESSDLIQIQENVLAKMIASLRFDGTK